MPLDFVPNFNPAKLLHGEQYLKIKGPIPTSATVINTARLMEVLDKGKAASVTMIVDTKDKATGESIFESQSTVVLRGSGGFGGKKNGSGEWSARRDVFGFFLAEGMMCRSRRGECVERPAEEETGCGDGGEDDAGAGGPVPSFGGL